jgi:hypothetical protein
MAELVSHPHPTARKTAAWRNAFRREVACRVKYQSEAAACLAFVLIGKGFAKWRVLLFQSLASSRWLRFSIHQNVTRPQLTSGNKNR